MSTYGKIGFKLFIITIVLLFVLFNSPKESPIHIFVDNLLTTNTYILFAIFIAINEVCNKLDRLEKQKGFIFETFYK